MRSFIIKLFLLTTFSSLWFCLSLKEISSHQYGLLSLVNWSTYDRVISSGSPQLLKRNIIHGEFTSTFPKLGIVSVRFTNHDRINQDKLIFRIKEKEASQWFYQGTYNTDQFQNHQLFPFGFPMIENSKGKKYIFEIESVSGTPEDSVSIDNVEPVVVYRSVYTKTDLKNPQNAIYFIERKFFLLIKDPLFVFQSLIYALPLLLLFTFSIFPYQVSLILILGFILWDIKTHAIYSDFLYISGSISMLILTTKFKLSFSQIKYISYGLFSLMVIFATLNQIFAAEKAATWLYLSLVITFLSFAYQGLRKGILKK